MRNKRIIWICVCEEEFSLRFGIFFKDENLLEAYLKYLTEKIWFDDDYLENKCTNDESVDLAVQWRSFKYAVDRSIDRLKNAFSKHQLSPICSFVWFHFLLFTLFVPSYHILIIMIIIIIYTLTANFFGLRNLFFVLSCFVLFRLVASCFVFQSMCLFIWSIFLFVCWCKNWSLRFSFIFKWKHFSLIFRMK